MTTLLLIGAGVVAVVLIATAFMSRRDPARRQFARRKRRVGVADPYAGQRRPDKLNPGLGGFGGGGVG
jgi:hypothetical protein